MLQTSIWDDDQCTLQHFARLSVLEHSRCSNPYKPTSFQKPRLVWKLDFRKLPIEHPLLIFPMNFSYRGESECIHYRPWTRSGGRAMKKNCPKIAKMLKKADPLQGFPSINRGLFKGATRGNRGSAAGRSLLNLFRVATGHSLFEFELELPYFVWLRAFFEL